MFLNQLSNVLAHCLLTMGVMYDAGNRSVYNVIQWFNNSVALPHHLQMQSYSL